MPVAKVKDVMTSDVTTLKRNEKLSLADDVMNLGRNSPSDNYWICPGHSVRIYAAAALH